MEQSNFLGIGWAFPPAFTPGGEEVLLVADETDIVQSLRILLATSLGERVMQENYGCNLRDYLFEELDQRLLENLRSAITEGIRQHEPRINLDDIGFDVDARLDQATIFIRIHFLVRATNSRYNMVHPFFLHEANRLP